MWNDKNIFWSFKLILLNDWRRPEIKRTPTSTGFMLRQHGKSNWYSNFMSRVLLKYFIRMRNIWFWNKKKIAHWQRSIQRVSQQRKVSQQTSATGQTVNLRPQQSRKVCVNFRLWTRWIWYHSTKRKMGQKWLLFNQNFHCSHLEFNVGTIWK